LSIRLQPEAKTTEEIPEIISPIKKPSLADLPILNSFDFGEDDTTTTISGSGADDIINVIITTVGGSNSAVLIMASAGFQDETTGTSTGAYMRIRRDGDIITNRNQRLAGGTSQRDVSSTMVMIDTEADEDTHEYSLDIVKIGTGTIKIFNKFIMALEFRKSVIT